MLHSSTRRELADQYHRQLPEDIRQYLNGRGIPDRTIDRYQLGWSGQRITIPVFSRDGEVLFFRRAKSPYDDVESPKVISDIGAGNELYGWDTLADRPTGVVICEGEFDRLVLESRGFPAVTATAGANAFLPEWAPYFEGIRHVYICFDRDEAGERGARRVQEILPQAKIVTLPDGVGEKGDVTDYFVRLGYDSADFAILLANAAAREPEPSENSGDGEEQDAPAEPSEFETRMSARAAYLKTHVPIASVVNLYTPLRRVGAKLVGHCPFHKDNRPSFTVYPSTGTYFCFGCGERGDVLTFLMRKESINFKEALDELERFHSSDDRRAS
jgi:DNA primase